MALRQSKVAEIVGVMCVIIEHEVMLLEEAWKQQMRGRNIKKKKFIDPVRSPGTELILFF